VRTVNFFEKTEYERHQSDKEEFKELMPLFARLTEDEGRILLHKIKNRSADEKLIA
jgi:hypothetical protein